MAAFHDQTSLPLQSDQKIDFFTTVITTATSEKEMQTTDCPVCHEKYSDPKILPCAHLLCRDCLVNWMKTKREALCPLCRSDIVDPKHSNIKNCEAFADLLPTDHAMSAMVESLKLLSEKHVCHVHNNIDAISLCLHCSAKLCHGCTEVHRKLPVTSFHNLENLAKLTPERLAASHHAPCTVHPDKTAELVCVDHNVLICQLCATAKHLACSEVTYVSEVSQKYKESLLEMESKLSAAESSLSQAITELEERLLKAEKSTNAALAEIDTTCDSLLMSVENCRKRLKKLVTEENDKMKAAFHEQKHIISQKRGRVTSHQGLIKRALHMANDSTLVAMVTNLESRVNDLDTCLPQDTILYLTVMIKIDLCSLSKVEKELSNIIEPIFSFATWTEKNTWKFHNNCGSNIVLSSNGQTAEVKDSDTAQNRVLISRETISTNELYEILVEETDTRYNRTDIVIGVCEENPLSVTLPTSCIQIKSFVGVQAFGGRYQGQWTKEYSCPALNTVKARSRLGVMVDTSHSLHVYVDGKDQRIMARNVAQPCYAVFDIYVLKKNTWMFHNNCGSNIVLSSNKKTAEVKNRNYSWNRVVMSNEPVSTNKLYEILVEQIDTQDSGKDTSGEFIVIGLCEDPISITLQSVSFERTFVGVHANKGISHCQWASEYSCPALKTVKGGSHLGVMVDTSHSLHVYVDGKDQGVMAKNVAQQCYAVFDLRYFLKKVSTLPVSTVL